MKITVSWRWKELGSSNFKKTEGARKAWMDSMELTAPEHKGRTDLLPIIKSL